MYQGKKVRIITESALCVAMAVVLSMITLFQMPLGGTVTPFATLPIIVIALRHGSRWGVTGALTFSLVQLLLGMANITAVPVKSFASMLLCAALDYVLAYTILGFSGAIARRFTSRAAGISAAIVITGFGRLVCSFLSGVLIWGPYAPEGWNVAYYSLAYNAAWCLPDTVITMIACLLLSRVSALGLLPADKADALT